MKSYPWWKYHLILALKWSISLLLFCTCVGILIPPFRLFAFLSCWPIVLLPHFSDMEAEQALPLIFPAMLIGALVNCFVCIVAFKFARVPFRKWRRKHKKRGYWDDPRLQEDFSKKS